MDPKQPTFIPRKSVTDTKFDTSHPVGIFSLISIAVFIVAVVGAAAVFAYTYFLNSSIASKQEELTRFEQELKSPVVRDIKQTAARLAAAENRLNAHLALSTFFDQLGAVTLRNVRWKNFRFEDQGGNYMVTMEGEARSFASVALQSDKITANPLFVSPLISNLNADKSGAAVFTFRTSLNPAEIRYATFVERALSASTETEDDTAQPEVQDESGTSTITQ